MENILLGTYNNYYNRILKRLDTWAEYNTAFNMSGIDFPHYNFNPADGVDTKIVVGFGDYPVTEFENGGPDYLIVYNDNKLILSRWFIIDFNRTRQGQYELTLKRDVLADFYHYVEDSPAYVEKGVINDLENPLLCNNEGLVVNQIKKQEITLEDETKCPWLVMYLPKEVIKTTKPGTSGVVTIDVEQNDGFVYETLNSPITSWTYYNYADCPDLNHTHSLDYKTSDNYDHIFRINFNAGLVSSIQYKLSGEGSTVKDVTWTTNKSNLEKSEWQHNFTAAKQALDGTFKQHYSTLTSTLKTGLGYKSYNDIMAYNGKIIKDSTGKYYEVTVLPGKLQTLGWMFIGSDNLSSLYTTMRGYWNSAASQSVTPNTWAFSASIKLQQVQIILNERTDIETIVDFNEYTGNGTIDSPLFDAICMPYGEVIFTNPGDLLHHPTSSADRSLKIMSDLARQLGGTNGYAIDLQLLPYCPVQELIMHGQSSPTMYIPNVHQSSLTGHATGSNLITDIILVVNTANNEFDINKSVSITDDSDVSDTFKKKYINDCTLFRLCSPNYNGLFEFNIAKNGGIVDKFNVDLTLRPFTPYIHVNPNFGFLYGYDFNDIRGLVCGGDFSLVYLNDAWEAYEIQNKNYQALFDRQIQNLDRNNAINKQEALLTSALGTITGAARGAAAGSGEGKAGAYGALAGAAIGGTAAGIGGVIDYLNLQARQREGRDFLIDNYNLQLGNVQALPLSISKTSALTKNNKLFPFVEIYECSEEEKEAYYLKLKYDGMTIGKIGYMRDYTSNDNSQFFKAKLIRMTIMEDAHIINEINNELSKGVYI